MACRISRWRAARRRTRLSRTAPLAGASIALAIAFTACAREAPPEEPVAAIAAADVEAAFEAFRGAWEREDLEAVLAAFTPDAVAFDPVPPGRFEGAEGIREWVGGTFSALDAITITTSDVRVSSAGPVAWLTARFVFEGRPPEGEALRDEGNVSMLWVRSPDGTYRSPLFHASPDPEPTTGG